MRTALSRVGRNGEIGGIMPSRKVGSAALAGGLSIILVWAIKQFGHVEIPPEVASGITTVLSFITGYVVEDAV